MIRQSVSWFGSAGVSFQNPSENMQLNQKLYDDTDNICEVPSHDLDLDEFEYQGIGHFHHDPIATYMEELFFSECQLIPGASLIFHSSKALCYEDQVGNQFLMPLQALVLMPVKNSKRDELLDQLIDWLHWHFSIT
jgi:hypothetical protein